MSLDDFKRKIQAYAAFDLRTHTAEVMNENSELLADLLRRQLSMGKDKDNKPVTVFGKPYYSPRTIKAKKYAFGLGAEINHITNYMTGEFYDSIYVFATRDSFTFDSAVPHFNDILLQSGEEIMQLNQENLSLFAESILLPELEIRFNAFLNGV